MIFDPQRQQAIDRVEESRDTHVQYLAFYRDHAHVDSHLLQNHRNIAGDEAHHQRAISGYDVVLEVLRTPNYFLRKVKKLFRR